MDYLKKAKDDLFAEAERVGGEGLVDKAKGFVNAIEAQKPEDDYSGYNSEFMNDTLVRSSRGLTACAVIFIRRFRSVHPRVF